MKTYKDEICKELGVTTIEEGLSKLRKIANKNHILFMAMDDMEFDNNRHLLREWSHATQACHWIDLMVKAANVDDDPSIQQDLIDEYYRRSMKEIEGLN